MTRERLQIDHFAEHAEMGRDLGEPISQREWVIRAIAVALGFVTACGIYIAVMHR
jgi:hypothetical protein